MRRSSVIFTIVGLLVAVVLGGQGKPPSQLVHESGEINIIAFIKSNDGNVFEGVKKALDYLSEAGGGTVNFPPGNYTVKLPGVRGRSNDIKNMWAVGDNTRIKLDQGAKIIADATSDSYILFSFRGKNSGLEGGTLVGDRGIPTPNIGTLVQVQSAFDTTIRHVNIENAGLDGITVSGGSGAPSVRTRIVDVDIKNSKRNNLSIINAEYIWVEQSSFTSAGGDDGADPQDGIDVEPNKHTWARNIWITDCQFDNNGGNGLHIISGVAGRDANGAAATSGVNVTGCSFENNGSVGVNVQVVDLSLIHI